MGDRGGFVTAVSPVLLSIASCKQTDLSPKRYG